MPVFISYSHEDKSFVDEFALQLVAHKVKVWIDRWELHVGDSLIKKVQEAIAGASALLVVLSKSSVQSEWCKKELSAGLVRELEEKRVVVLPILKEDCNVPLFLRDKLYADFRKNFDEGLQITLESIAKVTSNTLGRYDKPEYHIDWSIDWGTLEDYYCLRLTLVEQAKDQPYCVLTEIVIKADDVATNRHIDFDSKGLEEYSKYEIISLLHNEVAIKQDVEITLVDEMPKTVYGYIDCLNPKRIYDISITSRRLGEDTGRDILLDVGGQMKSIKNALYEINKPASDYWNENIENIKSLLTLRSS